MNKDYLVRIVFGTGQRKVIGPMTKNDANKLAKRIYLLFAMDVEIKRMISLDEFNKYLDKEWE